MYLVGCGMVTPVGLTFPASAAAMRAGLTGFVEIPFHDKRGKPIIGAPVPLGHACQGRERLLRLLLPAVRECLGAEWLEQAHEIILLLCTSEVESLAYVPKLDPWLLDTVQRHLGARFHGQSACLPQGRAGAAVALSIAEKALRDRAASACLVAGVDSLINLETLAFYDVRERLKTENNPDGLIPGEAAAAILIARRRQDQTWPTIKMAGCGFSREPVLPGAEEPVIGVGLADAIRCALTSAGIGLEEIDFRISDLTGERYGFKETNYALARLLRVRKIRFDLWHCMDSIGDTGAAAGVCMYAVVSAAFAKDYAPGPIALCQSSAESGLRAAVVLKHEHSSGDSSG